MMKNLLKKILRRLAHVPVIGHFVRIMAAIYRLPTLAETVTRINTHLDSNTQDWSEATKADLDNLVLSVPVALRKLRRDMDRLETILADLDRQTPDRHSQRVNTPDVDRTNPGHSPIRAKP
jgi:hypothetical protein